MMIMAKIKRKLQTRKRPVHSSLYPRRPLGKKNSKLVDIRSLAENEFQGSSIFFPRNYKSGTVLVMIFHNSITTRTVPLSDRLVTLSARFVKEHFFLTTPTTRRRSLSHNPSRPALYGLPVFPQCDIVAEFVGDRQPVVLVLGPI